MDTKENNKENNKVTIAGIIVSDFKFSHEIFGEGFYTMDVEVRRLSGTTDIIPVTISERIIDINSDMSGKDIIITGQFRSYNRDNNESQRRKLVLNVFAQDVEFPEEETTVDNDTNIVRLDGFICKETAYRKTPLGREITDILVAVNRPSYGKSDYIPCICWGRNARYAAGLEIGAHVRVYGRIQSRSYIKKIDEENVEERTAYEVSLNKIEVIRETETSDADKESVESNNTEE